MSSDARFWSKVDRRGPDECWEWRGPVNNMGYGISGHRQLAHRESYQLAYGPLPPDKPLVCHTCDNPPCCNPAHLRAGSHVDNAREMVARGRGRNKIHCGELNGNAKLTQEEAEQIRALSATETQRALAKRFGVSRATVSYIVNGMRYAA